MDPRSYHLDVNLEDDVKVPDLPTNVQTLQDQRPHQFSNGTSNDTLPPQATLSLFPGYGGIWLSLRTLGYSSRTGSDL